MSADAIASALVDQLPHVMPTDEQVIGLRTLLYVERPAERRAA